VLRDAESVSDGLQAGRDRSRKQGRAATELFNYIEAFCHRRRGHSTLGGLSPAKLEKITSDHDQSEGRAA
jgi:hypothetical protein